MPEIIHNEKQTKALEEIIVDLERVGQLNAAIKESEFTVVTTPKNSKAIKIGFSEKEGDKLVKFLAECKNKLVRDILYKAKENRIALSENEMGILR